MSIHKSFFLRWGLGVGLILYLLTLIDFREFAEVFSKGHWSFIAIAALIVMIDRVWMGAKWRILLKAQGLHISYFECIRAYFVASFFGLALPTSVGSDFVRLMNVEVPKGEREKVAASIVVEKLLAMFAMFLLVTICIFLLIWTSALDHWKYFFIATSSLGAVIIFFLLSLYYAPYLKYLNRFSGKFFHVIQKLISSYRQFRHHRRPMILFFFLSFAEQMMPFISTFVLARGFNLPGSALDYFMVVPLIYVVARIPISVDAIGVLELLFVFLLPLVGLDKTTALLLALAGRLAATTGQLLGGIFYFMGRKKSEAVCLNASI